MGDHPPDWALSEHVHQAAGMVAVQVGCDISEALARMRIRARVMEESLDDMALDVLDGVVHFDAP